MSIKIGVVATASGVSVDTVRFYERRGVLPPPERLASGYRTYTPATVARIQLARRLQGLGLTLDEVIEALHVADSGSATCDSERWRLEAVLDRIDAQMAELQDTRQEIRRVMSACDGGECVFTDLGAPQIPA